jgi:hypothetical protein
VTLPQIEQATLKRASNKKNIVQVRRKMDAVQAEQQEQAAFHEAAKELLRSRVFLDRSAAYPLDLIAHPRSTPLMVRGL